MGKWTLSLLFQVQNNPIGYEEIGIYWTNIFEIEHNLARIKNRRL